MTRVGGREPSPGAVTVQAAACGRIVDVEVNARGVAGVSRRQDEDLAGALADAAATTCAFLGTSPFPCPF
jgi:hypothetical protein